MTVVRARSAQRCMLAVAVAMGLFFGAALASCGGGQKVMLSPEEQDLRREEIRSLWAEIQTLETGEAPTAPADGDDDKVTSTGRDPGTDQPAPVSAQSMDESVGAREPRSARVRRADMCHLSDEARGARCADVCHLAESICDNAERICRIADELGYDAWASGRCTDASQACRRADARCCGCAE